MLHNCTQTAVKDEKELHHVEDTVLAPTVHCLSKILLTILYFLSVVGEREKDGERGSRGTGTRS